VAYKSDIDDVRESPALDIIHLLRQRGASITYSDPHVPELRAGPALMTAVPMRPAAAEADCAVVITAHSPFDYVSLAREAALIVDNPQRARRDGSW
jgi:UDP-N-acetyl-D-glucosamine dehydrogenase